MRRTRRSPERPARRETTPAEVLLPPRPPPPSLPPHTASTTTRRPGTPVPAPADPMRRASGCESPPARRPSRHGTDGRSAGASSRSTGGQGRGTRRRSGPPEARHASPRSVAVAGGGNSTRRQARRRTPVGPAARSAPFRFGHPNSPPPGEVAAAGQRRGRGHTETPAHSRPPPTAVPAATSPGRGGFQEKGPRTKPRSHEEEAQSAPVAPQAFIPPPRTPHRLI